MLLLIERVRTIDYDCQQIILLAFERRIIDENYAKKLTLESIGPLLGYNSAYLGKIFAAKTGCSFNVYRDRVRIEKSKALLSGTPLKIYEIAERVSYRNVDIYNQKFKKQEGISPSDYRRRLGR
jgi:two-component system response regulator YesN